MLFIWLWMNLYSDLSCANCKPSGVIIFIFINLKFKTQSLQLRSAPSKTTTRFSCSTLPNTVPNNLVSLLLDFSFWTFRRVFCELKQSNYLQSLERNCSRLSFHHLRCKITAGFTVRLNSLSTHAVFSDRRNIIFCPSSTWSRFSSRQMDCW